MITGISSVNTVITVFINLHIELFTGLYQCFCIIHRLLEVYIIVSSSAHSNSLPCKSFASRIGEVAA